MKTSIIGYPRVGVLRELKFATEKYFRGELTVGQLQKTGKEIRKNAWIKQKENAIDFIPSNDFSFYDTVLDTAILFNMIPIRYKKLRLSELDTYFAMARGYQGDKGDVKALPMKKWFNTNYHYIVPEIEDETEIKLANVKPVEMYLEAKALGIETKPVIVGAFTLLKLAHYSGTKTIEDYVTPLVTAYQVLLQRFEEIGVKWIQFDEPYLVHDLNEKEQALFEKVYDNILRSKGNLNILLQTYFGDIRDIYQKVTALHFDGIGLDFVEGKKTLELVKRYGFPKDKRLFAGLINGKNIWKNDYRKSLTILSELKDYNVVLNTSCSLLHIPYTLKNETKLSQDYLEHFAFAEEKLVELNEIRKLIETNMPYTHTPKNRMNCCNETVQQRVAQIKEEDFIRKPCFEEREVIQKNTFQLPLYPTTTIGSFPQTTEVKAYRTALKKGMLTEEEYVEKIRAKIAECVALQEEIGLDVLVHGEFERNDMVEYFGEQLKGYLFTEKAWVQSYGTRCVKPPIIWGDISREKSMTVTWSTYAQSLTQKPMKGMLTGPVTILNWSFPREDISLKESALQIALAIRDEVLELEKNGIKIIQIDEAALREKLPLRQSDWNSDYLDWALPAFRLVHSGVRPETQIHTHMCYSEFTDIISAIDQMDADVITFEASRSNLDILETLKAYHFKTEVGPGVYDIHSPRVPSIEEIKEILYQMLKKIEPQKLWVNPDCGLKTRGEVETVLSLKNLVWATKAIR